jgi:hypothetical protein
MLGHAFSQIHGRERTVGGATSRETRTHQRPIVLTAFVRRANSTIVISSSNGAAQ